MPNQSLNKGNFLTLNINPIAYDGTPDVTTPANVAVIVNTTALTLTPDTAGTPPGQAVRRWFAKVQPELTVNVNNLQILVSMSLAGAFGAPAVNKNASPDPVNVTVPPDNRALTASWDPVGQLPLPHP